jgi:hypothetical protein
MIIELNRHEVLMCELFGSIRRKNAMQFNYDRQVSKQNPYDMDIDGFMGEFMVAKHLNVMPDFTINEKKNAVDLLWNNKTIDVKTTRNPRGNVYVTEYHRKSPCDIYIQVVLEDAHIGRITGWIGKETMFDVAELQTGNHPSYCIKQSDLEKESLSEFYYNNA